MRGVSGWTVGGDELELDRLHGDYKVWTILTDRGFFSWRLYRRACRFLERKIRRGEATLRTEGGNHRGN